MQVLRSATLALAERVAPPSINAFLPNVRWIAATAAAFSSQTQVVIELTKGSEGRPASRGSRLAQDFACSPPLSLNSQCAAIGKLQAHNCKLYDIISQLLLFLF